MSGFLPPVRAAIAARDRGRCVRCGIRTTQIHHRRPRGMGGSRDEETNQPANGILLCGSGTQGCHGWVESERSVAEMLGYLVPQGARPADVPVQYYRQFWYQLDNAGSRTMLTSR